jgi:hypothetical protein
MINERREARATCRLMSLVKMPTTVLKKLTMVGDEVNWGQD